jgi:hypothetical protein
MFSVGCSMLDVRLLYDARLKRYAKVYLPCTSLGETSVCRISSVEAGKIESFERGLNDIVIHSGPHLGDFNAPISLPELIESVASMAALCVSGKYWCERHENAEG